MFWSARASNAASGTKCSPELSTRPEKRPSKNANARLSVSRSVNVMVTILARTSISFVAFSRERVKDCGYRRLSQTPRHASSRASSQDHDSSVLVFDPRTLLFLRHDHRRLVVFGINRIAHLRIGVERHEPDLETFVNDFFRIQQRV